MNPERWQHIEALYREALAVSDSGKRAVVLANADPELRRDVEALLAQEGHAGESTATVVGVGTQLGRYVIEAPLGKGGMGEVFRARDTRLGRSVAIKVSNAQFSERFEREARAISSLNHPHICTLYDVGPNYLVMELCEGETLAARLKRGKLSLEESLRCGAQIADALAEAHAKGITHRDLKPGNIMIAKSGVKVLDFGLAKSQHDAGMTASNVVMGTPAYMAPEQIEGKDADTRTDIYALGLIVYEMATGKRTVQGQLPAMDTFPRPLAHVVERCLAQDQENRWQTARDVKAELEWATKGDFGARPEGIPRRAIFPWIAGTAVAGAAGGAGLAAWVWRGKSPPLPAQVTRLRLAAPEGTRFQRIMNVQSAAVSPVGGRVAMIATGERGRMVWVQRLDSLTARPLQGTEGAVMVFWSPDGQFIGFWAGGKLKKISVEGGTPVPICDVPPPWSASWNEAGVIITAGGITAGGLTPTWIIQVNSGATTRWKSVSFPKFLPDGKHLLYLSLDPKIGGYRAYVEEYATGRQTPLMPTDTQVLFVQDQPGSSRGHLISGRGATLLAQRFDTDGLRLSGEPAAVAEDVPFFRRSGWSEFDAAPGILIYFTGFPKAQLNWMDRGGHKLGNVGDPQAAWTFFRLSSDDKMLAFDAFDLRNGGTDVWTYDLSKNTAERVTSDAGLEVSPVWSPDGTRLAFGSGQDGSPPQLKVKALGERGGLEGFPPGDFQTPSDWSRDGRWIAYGTFNDEIWVASPTGHKIMPLLQTGFSTQHAVFSPQGEYLAFASNENGRREVYVQRFEAGESVTVAGQRLRVSKDGGSYPRWRRDGKELFFLSADRQMMAVAVQQGPVIGFGPPTALFPLPPSFPSLSLEGEGFEVSADGQKLLVLTRSLDSSALQVMVNWQSELKG